MKPKYYFPVIGEYRNQVENALLAEKLNISKENILLNLNGEVITFIDGRLVDDSEKIKIDEILIDGKTVGDIGDLVLKDREMLSDSGIVIVNVNINKETRAIINKPNIITKGFIYVKDNIEILKESEAIVSKVVIDNVKEKYIDYNKVKNGIREKLGKYLYKETECKPMIIIVIQEI